MQKREIAVQNLKLVVQNGEIESDWQVQHLEAKLILDKQNGEQKRDKIWTN